MFNVGLSFAEEDRPVARKLACSLKKKFKLYVFFDEFEEIRITGSFLSEELYQIFRNETEYYIPIISRHYKEKPFARHEWRAIQDRTFAEPDLTFIFPVRLDNAEIPGLFSNIRYLSLKKYPIDKIAEIIYKKIASKVEISKIIRRADKYQISKKYAAAINLLKGKRFDQNIDALRIRGECYRRLNNHKESILNLKKIAKKLPKDFLSHFLIANSYFAMGQLKESIRYSEIANKLFPRHPTVLANLKAAKRKLRVLK